MKKLHARNTKPKKKGNGKDKTRRKYIERASVATVPGEPLNIWKCWASFLGWNGYGRRGVANAKPRRRWWCARQTIWKRDPDTGQMVIWGHRRPDHFYARLAE